MLLNMRRKEDHLQIVTDDVLIDYIIGSKGNDISDDEDDEDERDQAPSRLEALRAVTIVKHCALGRSLLYISHHSKLFTLQRGIRKEKVNLQKQLTLDAVLE